MKTKLLVAGLVLLMGVMIFVVFRDKSRLTRMRRVFNLMFYALLVIYGYVFIKLFLLPLFIKY